MFKRKVVISVEAKATIQSLLSDLTYELIPLSNVLPQAEFLPEGARVSVTASPAKGMQATVDLSLELQQRGFDVVPHISARLTEDRAQLGAILKQIDRLSGRWRWRGSLRLPGGTGAPCVSLPP